MCLIVPLLSSPLQGTNMPILQKEQVLFHQSLTDSYKPQLPLSWICLRIIVTVLPSSPFVSVHTQFCTEYPVPFSKAEQPCWFIIKFSLLFFPPQNMGRFAKSAWTLFSLCCSSVEQLQMEFPLLVVSKKVLKQVVFHLWFFFFSKAELLNFKKKERFNLQLLHRSKLVSFRWAL